MDLCLKWWTLVWFSMTVCDRKLRIQCCIGTKDCGNCFSCLFGCIWHHSWHPASTDFGTTKMFSNCLCQWTGWSISCLLLGNRCCVSVYQPHGCCQPLLQCKHDHSVASHEVLLLLFQLLTSTVTLQYPLSTTVLVIKDFRMIPHIYW